MTDDNNQQSSESHTMKTALLAASVGWFCPVSSSCYSQLGGGLRAERALYAQRCDWHVCEFKEVVITIALAVVPCRRAQSGQKRALSS